MCTLGQIEATLKDSPELRQEIVRNVGSSTVALFAISNAHGSESLKLAGTGTLVSIDDSHYILTAAHVWEESLQSAAQLGITITDNLRHKFPIEIQTIIPTLMKPDSSQWNEWGPDLALLEIPPVLVGTISARLVFEDLKAPPKPVGAESIECWIAMGTPAELGTFTENHAEVEISGDFVSPVRQFRENHDYWNYEVDTTRPGMPKDFGGFSGGGLWRVLVYCSPKTGKIDWTKRLKGVIFWQTPLVNDRRVIRAHGPKGILVGLLNSNST